MLLLLLLLLQLAAAGCACAGWRLALCTFCAEPLVHPLPRRRRAWRGRCWHCSGRTRTARPCPPFLLAPHCSLLLLLLLLLLRLLLLQLLQLLLLL